MTTVTVSPNAGAALSANKYARNGMMASVQAQNDLVAAYNHAVRYRTRELFALGGQTRSIMASGGAGALEVTRGYSWTSAFSLRARYSLVLAKPSSAAVADPYVQLDLYDAGGSLIGSAQAHYGSATGAPNDTPDEWQEHTGTIVGLDSNAGAACTCVVSAFNNARFIAGTVWEESVDPDTASGYQGGVNSTQSILTGQRGQIAAFSKQLVDHAGGTQICCPDVTFATASATQKNIFDQTSTTVTANTPGITLDMRYKGRRSKTDVPIVVAVFGACSAGANGLFKLYNAAGAVLLTIGPFSTTPAWLTGTVRVPLTQAKYDLMLSTAASTTTILYVSLLEQGT